MALTRKSLKAMGLTDEQVDSIIEMHTETVDGLKVYKTDAEKLPEVQAKLDKALEDLKAKGDDGWKDKHDAIKKEFDDYKKAQKGRETREAKEKAYRELLKEAGVSEKRMDAILKVSDLDSLDLDDDGKIKDAKKVTESVKEEWADFIVKEDTKGADTSTPHSNGGGSAMTKDEIMKIRDPMERQNAIAANMGLFRKE